MPTKEYYWKNRNKIREQSQKTDKIFYQKHRDDKLNYQHDYYMKDAKQINFSRWKKNKVRWHKILDDLKINGCAICGYDKCTHALDFHHVNPEDKKFKINVNFMAFKVEKITTELNKCILLCSNCHREIHKKQLE
jgi:ribosomal protein L32